MSRDKKNGQSGKITRFEFCKGVLAEIYFNSAIETGANNTEQPERLAL